LQGKGNFTGAFVLVWTPNGGAWESETGTRVLSSKGLTAMLVLSRKKNESIVINNDITVTVVEIRGDKVRLGIVAPKEVPVHRQEVYEAIHGKPADTETNTNAVAKPVD
jgi:carbon storage regulator